ncbi:hypothetical protein ABLO27_05680 [Roseibium sp. SCPC15]|uniref:hypothetical protein n=1 Tax=Roseibium sp. SCP15 TaxID=3141376 RepID=UPI003339E054
MVLFRTLASLMTLTSVSLDPAKAETWKIAAPEWPPYASATLAKNGKAIAALRNALAKAGIDLKVEFMPWTRAQTVAGSPDYTGYFPAWPEEVLDGFTASDPVAWSMVGIAQRSDTTIEWSTLEDLFLNYRVGFVKTYVYPSDMQRQIYRYYDPDDGAENEQDLARVLAAGRVDVALTDPIVMLHTAQDLSLDGIDETVTILQRHPLVLAFTKHGNYEDKLRLLNGLLSENSITETACCRTTQPTSEVQPSD